MNTFCNAICKQHKEQFPTELSELCWVFNDKISTWVCNIKEFIFL